MLTAAATYDPIYNYSVSLSSYFLEDTIRAIKINPYILQDIADIIPDRYGEKQLKKFFEIGVMYDPNVIVCVPREFIKNNTNSLYISDWFKNLLIKIDKNKLTDETILKLCKYILYNFEIKKLFNKRFKNLVSNNGLLLKYMKNSSCSIKLYELAIKNNPYAIIYVDPSNMSFGTYRELCEKSIFYASINRYLPYSSKYIITLDKRNCEIDAPSFGYNSKIILYRRYLILLYDIYHNFTVLSNLNLLEIATIQSNDCTCDITFDCYELIQMYL